MEQTTENTKPFACPVCTSRFTRQVIDHEAVHRKSNRRPFPCPQCDVSFSRSDLRKRHIRKCHPQPEEAMPPNPMSLEESVADPGLLHVLPTISPAIPIPIGLSGPPSANISVSDIFSPQNISWLFKLPQIITAYFEKFHPSFPLLHQPTFDATTAREPLLQAIACIGAMYYDPGCNISATLFENALKTLDAYVRDARSVRIRETWVLQAYVLLEYYALYTCRDDLYPTALRLHRKLVDAARKYQLLQDGVTLGSEIGTPPGQPTANDFSLDPANAWRLFIENESRKRIMYCLYYLDAQFAICCNVRSMLTALELKYELPCRDDIWSAPTAEAWSLQAHSPDLSFNEEDDLNGNGDPRPAQGDLYESLMFLMNPEPPGRPLGLLWYSSFASLMLVTQVLMMTRDLTVASTFLYNNIRCEESRHSLSIISEGNRAPIMQALNALADLMPRPKQADWPLPNVDPALWYPIWIAWHYTAISLTHQDALLTSGIVEYSLPTAISTAWELGKPRSKHYRDVYEDRDVIRVVNNLENILTMLSNPPTSPGLQPHNHCHCTEDPFTTMLGFKACMMGWRIVRLMTLGLEPSQRSHLLPSGTPSIYSLSAQVVLEKIKQATHSEDRIERPSKIRSGQFPGVNSGYLGIFSETEVRYLEWMEYTFASRDTWPLGEWIVAVFNEARQEAS